MKKLSIIILILTSTFTFSQNNFPEMVFVEGGTFIMGNDSSEWGKDDKPEHEVTLKSFHISKYEVTVKEYNIFCKAYGMPVKQGWEEHPAYNINWIHSIKYCNWLSETQGFKKCYIIKKDTDIKNINYMVEFDTTANGYRLPTEAEWEYAAKGGKKSKGFIFSGSNVLYDVAQAVGGNGVRPVGTKKPNELGIYEMTGNVIEWCWDYYNKDYYKISPEYNPLGPVIGESRVCRGGNFVCTGDFLRNTKRFNLDPEKEDGITGIRLVRNAE